VRAAAAFAVGLVFGLVLSWSGMTSQGVAWSLATTGGLVLGVWLFLQRAESAGG
jgi:hypothetical protein